MTKAIFHYITSDKFKKYDGQEVSVYYNRGDLYRVSLIDKRITFVTESELEFLPRHASEPFVSQYWEDLNDDLKDPIFKAAYELASKQIAEKDAERPDWVGAKVILTHVPEDQLGPAIDEYLVKGYDNDLYYGWCTDGDEGGLEWNELAQDVEVIVDAEGRTVEAEKFKHLNFNQQKTIRELQGALDSSHGYTPLVLLGDDNKYYGRKTWEDGTETWIELGDSGDRDWLDPSEIPDGHDVIDSEGRNIPAENSYADAVAGWQQVAELEDLLEKYSETIREEVEEKYAFKKHYNDLKQRCIEGDYLLTETLAPALGYQRDPEYGLVIGDHTGESLALEVPTKISELENEVEQYKESLAWEATHLATRTEQFDKAVKKINELNKKLLKATKKKS